MTKKKIIIITITAILIAAMTASVLIIFKPFNKPAPVVVVNKESADNLKAQALKTIKEDKDTSKAKTLLEEAKKQYETLNDENNVIDTAAQLWILGNPIAPTPK